MKVGVIGLGKVGLPIALSVESRRHEVKAFDVDSGVVRNLKERHHPFIEQDLKDHLDASRITIAPIDELVTWSDVILIIVQTPNGPEYEGVTPFPETRQPFDVSYLEEAVRSISAVLDRIKRKRLVVVVSTVLPGTVDMYVKPCLSSYAILAYVPLFIAMGTAMSDFLQPEFVLIGTDDLESKTLTQEFYQTLTTSPIVHTSIKSAELAKVAYNTFIDLKIVYANTLMEICYKTGADLSEVTNALVHGHDRILSPKYLSGGMGDGGPCHPRDSIALSWLAQQLTLSHDIFADVMLARQHQTEWLASLAIEQAEREDCPIVLLGIAFKANTNIVTGSSARLLQYYLEQRGYTLGIYDPLVNGSEFHFGRSVFIVSTNHEAFKNLILPNGSLVLDPWDVIPEQPSVRTIRIGRSQKVGRITTKAANR